MSRWGRPWAMVVLALLVAGGFGGKEVWPITAWRLFSLSRDDTQVEWALDVGSRGRHREVDLEALPLAFRNAGWPLADLDGAPEARQQAVCEALLAGVRAVMPAPELVLVRETRHLRVVDGETVIDEVRDPVHACG